MKGSQLTGPTSPTPEARASTKAIRIPQHVVFRAFVSETVVLNLSTGRYYGINPTGGRMLEVLTATPRIDEAAAALAEEFRVPLERVTEDLTTFCHELAGQGLLEITEADRAGA